MASDTEFQPQLRLHNLSWLFALGMFIRQMIVPLLAVLFLDAKDEAALWSPVLLIPLLGAALWKQYFYRYGFGPRGLVIREGGLLFNNVRQIEYGRIENIDTERGLLHRVFDVALVRIETSTGGKPEALIRVLGLDAVREMRERVFSTTKREAPDQSAAAAETVLLKLPPAELVRFGLIDNRGMIVVAAALGAVYQTGFMEVAKRTVEAWFDSSPLNDFTALGHLTQFMLVAAVIIAALLVVRLLSVALALVTLFDFTLTRHGSDLRARYGSLTSVALTLRLPRIQAVHQTESLLHRLFSRVSLRVDLAGDSGQEQQQQDQSRNHTRWLAPVISPQRAGELIAMALPDIHGDSAPDWQPLAPGARKRIFKKAAFLWMLVTAFPAIWFTAHWAPLILLAGVPIAWLHASLYVRHTRWALTRDAILFRSGWLTRTLVIAPRSRIQVADVAISPFDARHRMAVVCVDTAGASPFSGLIRIPYLEQDTAWRIAKALYASVPGDTVAA